MTVHEKFWGAVIARTPRIVPYLEPLARRYYRTGRLPRVITLGEETDDPDVVQALENTFEAFYVLDGRFTVEIAKLLRTDESMQALRKLLEPFLARPPDPAPEKAMVSAIRLQRGAYPALADCLDQLRTAGDLLKFFKEQPQPEQLLQGLLATATFIRENRQAPVTLCELGRRFFNNEHALHDPAAENLLLHILAVLQNEGQEASRSLFARFGIVANPCTTQAVLYGDFSYEQKGVRQDWPSALYKAGQSVILSWEQLHALSRLDAAAPLEGVITSEHVKPFQALVGQRLPYLLVLTNGYPNAAVVALLTALARQNWTCLHWGSTDPTGLRIAERVARVIPTTLIYSRPDRVEQPPGARQPLTTTQQQQLADLLAASPEFPFAREARDALARGWTDQRKTRLLTS